MEGATDRSSALRMEALSITRSESAILPATTTTSQSSAALTAAPVEVNTPEQAKRRQRAIQKAAHEKTRAPRDRSNRTRPAQDRKRAEIREQRALQRRGQSLNVWPYDLHRIREQLGEKYSETMMKQRFEEMKTLPSGIMDTSEVLRAKWEAGVQEAEATWKAYKAECERQRSEALARTASAAAAAAYVDAARNGYPDGHWPNTSKD